MTRFTFPLGITLAAFAVHAQSIGSAYDPQLREMVLEAKVPLNWVLSHNPDVLSIPPAVVAAIQAGQLELRGRVELLSDGRTLRVRNFITSPAAPMPLSETPDLGSPNVGGGFDMGIDKTTWFEFRSSYTNRVRQVVSFTGRALPPLKGGAAPGEPCVISFGFDQNQPENIYNLFVTIPGELTAGGATAVGVLKVDKALFKAN